MALLEVSLEAGLCAGSFRRSRVQKTRVIGILYRVVVHAWVLKGNLRMNLRSKILINGLTKGLFDIFG